MTNGEKLLNFRTMTIEAARKKGADEVSSYIASMEKTLEEHKAAKKQQAEEALRAERENLHREKNKAISLEQIRLRHECTNRNEELKGKLFAEVNDLLAQYMSDSEYVKFLQELIRKDLEFAGGEQIVIYLDPADKEHLMSLEIATGAALTISEYSFGGGIRAVLPNRNLLIDDSFATKVKENMENFSFRGGEYDGK